VEILFISQTLRSAAGGAAVSEASLCGILQKRHRVRVLCRKGALDESFARGFGLTDVKEFTPWDCLQAARDPIHWLRQAIAQSDVVHFNGHWKWEFALLGWLCDLLETPYVLHPRGMLLEGHRKPLIKKVFNHLIGYRFVRGASKVVALSQFERKQWGSYSISPERVVVIPNGVQSTDGEKAVSAMPPASAYFLYFGRLEKRKNLLSLIETFARYQLDGGTAQLLLVGPTEAGYEKQLSHSIVKWGLQTRVRVLEPVYGKEKFVLMKHAIAVIYPSRDEAFGRVPFEVIETGGVPLVPQESGSAEYLAPYLPFCLFPIADTDALLACMRSIEQKKEEALPSGLEAARAWVKSELNWEAIQERMVSLYSEAVSQKQTMLSGAGPAREAVSQF
jgi:glycosyltransferase involved in cell wall biosynthesis